MRISDGSSDVCSSALRSQPMDELLSRLSATSGIFITAWNPRSEIRPEDENREAAQRLQSAIGRRGLSALPHCGFGADPAWQPEEGLFVLDQIGRASCRERVCQYV